MKARILYTGATGLIGRYFSEMNPDPEKSLILGLGRSERPDWKFQGLHRFAACDFADRQRFQQLLREFKPNVIINAGGEGNVDVVEKSPETYFESSLQFLSFLLEEAVQLGSKVVHFSSNAIYDGNHAPYNENDLANPISAYGKLKMALDSEVRRYPGEWAIVRPIVCYGWNFPFARANPVSAFVPKILAGQKLRVVDDQWENPVYAGDVAEVLWKSLQSGFCGELNVAGGNSRISRYDWIRAVAQVFGHPEADIERAKISEFTTAAPRPPDTSFDIGRLRRELEFQPKTVEEGALAMRMDHRRSHLQGDHR